MLELAAFAQKINRGEVIKNEVCIIIVHKLHARLPQFDFHYLH